jgi:serine protease
MNLNLVNTGLLKIITVVLVLLASGVCVSCRSGTSGLASPTSEGFVRIALTDGFAPDVESVRIDVKLGTRIVATQTVSLSLITAAQQEAPRADAFFVLPSGDYEIVATSLAAGGKPSSNCPPASSRATVVAEQTTEIALAVICGGTGTGGLDILVTSVYAPRITGFAYHPLKYIATCQTVEFEVTVEDAEPEQLSYSWRVVTSPDGTDYDLQPFAGGRAAFRPLTRGSYGLEVTVKGSSKLESRLAFPVHASGAKRTAEQCENAVIVVDPTVAPRRPLVPSLDGQDQRPVAAVTNAKRHVAEFIENELVVMTRSADDVEPVRARLGATVVSSVAANVANGPYFHTLRLDPKPDGAGGLRDAILNAQPAFRGELRFSSQRSLGLLAAAAEEARSHQTSITPNWLFAPHAIADRSTIEAPAAVPPLRYTPDAFSWTYMSRGSTQDIGVGEAWRVLIASGRDSNRVSVAILDGGFNLNPDLPPSTIALGAVGQPNPSSCTGPCPWHGLGVSAAGFAIPDNNFGVAGPGGLVTTPLLMQSPALDVGAVLQFLFVDGPRLLFSGVAIANISAGVPIPAGVCLTGLCITLDEIGSVARAAGVLLVASAGNNNADVDEEDCFIGCWEDTYWAPCEMRNTLCVGGLATDSTARDPNSNYGSKGGVQLFGPFTVFVPNDPVAGIVPNSVGEARGTSFAAPFVAGVAALVKAANPSLGPGDLERILIETAHVRAVRGPLRWVNAYEAVRAGLGGNLPPSIRIVRPTNEASFPGLRPVTLEATVEDDRPRPIVSWFSDRQGLIAAGTNAETRVLEIGRHTITALATDGEFSAQDTVVINITNTPPVVTIAEPVAGAHFFLMDDVPLAGRSFDENQFPSSLRDDQVRWLRGASGVVLATGHRVTIRASTLGIGTHTLRFEGNDGTATGIAGVSFTIDPNPSNLPPSAAILQPATDWTSGAQGIVFTGFDDALGLWYADIPVVGTASDPEDGPMSGASLTWSTNRTDIQPASLGSGTAPTIRLFANDCFGTEHVVELAATDSSGNVRRVRRHIFIFTLC